MANLGYLENSKLFVVSATSKYAHKETKIVYHKCHSNKRLYGAGFSPKAAGYNESGNVFFIIVPTVIKRMDQLLPKR
jgi:hypothetical protein